MGDEPKDNLDTLNGCEAAIDGKCKYTIATAVMTTMKECNTSLIKFRKEFEKCYTNTDIKMACKCIMDMDKDAPNKVQKDCDTIHKKQSKNTQKRKNKEKKSRKKQKKSKSGKNARKEKKGKGTRNNTDYMECFKTSLNYAKITQRKGNNIEKQIKNVMRKQNDLNNKKAKKGEFKSPYKTLLDAMGGDAKNPKCKGKAVRNKPKNNKKIKPGKKEK